MIVLLKVDWMNARPAGTLFLSRFLPVPFRSAIASSLHYFLAITLRRPATVLRAPRLVRAFVRVL